MTLSLDSLNQQVQESNAQQGQAYELADQNCVYVGHPVKEYKKNKKDAKGKTLKDAEGKAIKEDEASGLQYTFVKVGSFIPVRVVVNKELPVKIGMVFAVSGKGYAFTNEKTNKVESYFFQDVEKIQQYR